MFTKEKQLRENQEEFKTNLYSIGDGVITTDTAGRIKRMNYTAQNILGLSEKETINVPIQNIFNVINEKTREKVKNPVYEVLENENISMLARDTILVTKDGKELPISDSAAPIKNEEDKIEGVVLVFHDNSIEYRTNKLLKQNEARLNRAQFVSKSGNWELHMDTNTLIASEGAKRIYGLYGDEFSFSKIREVPLKKYRDTLDKALKELINEGKPYDLEFKIKKFDTGEILDVHSVAEYHKNKKILFGVIQDITEQKKLEQKQLEFLEIIEKSLNEIYLFDAETLEFEYVNEGALKNLGYRQDEIRKMRVIDIKPLVDEKSFREKISPLLNSETENIVFETVHRRKDGSEYPVETHHQIYKIGNRNVFFAIVNDITERKKSENALRESERFLNNLLDAIPVPIFFKNKEGKYLGCNAAYANFFGKSTEVIMGKNVFDLYPEDAAEFYSLQDQRLYSSLGTQIYETQFKDADNVYRDILLHKAAFTNDKNEVAGLIGVMLDITDRKSAEIALSESEERLRTTLYSIGDGVISTDIDGNVTQMNYIAERLTGYNEIEAVGKPLDQIFKIINENTRETIENPVCKVLKEGKITGLANHTILISKDNNEIPIADSGAPILDKQNNMTGVVLVFRDQINEREARKTLLESELQLKQSQKVARVGYYIFDLQEGKWESSEMLDLLFGIDEDYNRNIQGWFELIHPFYRNEMKEYLFNKVLKEKNDFNKEYKIVNRKNNSELWVHVTGSLDFDEEGNAIKLFGTIQDLTERKDMEMELLANKERWESLFRNSPSGIAIYESINDGEDFIFTDFNQTAERTDNISQKDVIGKKISEVFPSADELGFLETFRRVWKTGKTEHMDVKFYEDNRITGWRDNRIFRLNTGEVVAIYEDVSKRKRAEIALRESEAKFKAVVKNADAIIVQINADAIITLLEGKALNLLNVTSEDFIGVSAKELFKDDPYMIDKINEALKGKQIQTIVRNNNYMFECLFTPIFNEENNFVGTIAIAIDITERIKMLEELNKLSTAVEQSQISIMITDYLANIEYVNPYFCKLTGYEKSDVIGQNPRFLKSGETTIKEYKQMWDHLLSGKTWTGVFHNKKKNNELFWDSAIITPIKDIKGKITHFIAVKEDITDKVKKENELNNYKTKLEDLVNKRTVELNKANIQLAEQLRKEKEIELILKSSLENEKEINEMKTRFISTTSHEFRTPLTSVLSSVELIERYGKKWSEEKFNSHVQRIKKSVDYITKLLDEVLTISRAESGKITYEPQKINLDEFCREILDEVKSLIDGKAILNYYYLIEKQYFSLDIKLLKYILANLLSNAIKYSPDDGEINFKVLDSESQIIFEVEDNGLGIPDEEKEHLFEPFYRCLNTGDIPGTGLGLSIVKQSVDMHKGSIFVKSKIGKGSKFTVKLNKVN